MSKAAYAMSKADDPDFSHDPPPSYYASVGQGSAAGGGPTTYYPPAPVVTAQPIAMVTTVVPLGPESIDLSCPFCHAGVTTNTKSVPSMKAYLVGAILCFIGCDCGCCLIPCCMESCMDVEHQCPNCNKFLGKYQAA